ncbi:MAG: phosphonoacetaldehyde reductase [Candidatus Amulumruptor caecigallinarius]|nr:phosphonoacetaldehyde reductase [Candidatus Amulumruptor caecigallinarius]MCM1397178.1 phosphonoacetaldehyde reductase [Candidatus Amulumruptor caecigallinarius]MCM1453133.1 phosphonoacetaldehyde reductase [bacterium]
MTDTQHFFVGRGALAHLWDFMPQADVKRVLAVHGRGSYAACGLEAGLLGALGPDVEVADFCDFDVNPNSDDLARGLALARSFHPDLIVGAGGGSAIDMAKLIRHFLANPAERGEDAVPLYSRLVAVPSTAGTGSETTRFAVMYVGKVKHSVDHEDVRPDVALVDSAYSSTMNPYVTACTGFDALAQAVEAFWNRNATPESDAHALRAIGLIAPAIVEAVEAPGPRSRELMAEGAFEAGRAINITRTTAPHAFSYPFTSHYGYPHGHAVALTFPSLAEFNLRGDAVPAAKKMQLAEALGCDPEEIPAFFRNLCSRLGLTLRTDVQYDMELLRGGINTARLSNNPVAVTDDDACRLLTQILTPTLAH